MTAVRVGAIAMMAGLFMIDAAAQHTVRRPIDGRPDATVDLGTREGAAVVNGRWQYSDASIARVAFNAPGADLKPSGPQIETFDHAFRPGTPEFETAGWTSIEPTTLDTRRGSGKLSFSWYRLTVTIPARIGDLDIAGTTVVFETVVDDYAEIWVDGRLPRTLGQTGGTLVRGFNAANRVVLTRHARPGQRFEIAILGANGPLSDPPANYVWIRSATLDFFKAGATTGPTTPAQITRIDPAIDAIVPSDAAIEQLADGFLFTEGPVWVPDGYLLFSDPNANTIYRWSDDDGLSVYRSKSGYTGADIGRYKQPGSNGLALDSEGRLTINEHGNRRVTRIEKNGVLTVLADRHDGKRLNSPNDLVYRSDGSLYFTDPPFGLPKVFDDPGKDLPFSGVYRWSNGRVQLVARDLSGPNGLALSPDERFLYVGNWDEKKKVVMKYEIKADGTLAAGRVFFDMTSAPGEDAIDGVKVDRLGNVYVSGPGGLWVISPDGKRLGTINGPQHVHNMAWGDSDGRTLYLAARSGLYRIRLNVSGFRPGASTSQ